MKITTKTTKDTFNSMSIADLRVIVKAHDLVVKGLNKGAIIDAVWAWAKPQVEDMQYAEDCAAAEAAEAKSLALLEDAANPISVAVLEGFAECLNKEIARKLDCVNAFKARATTSIEDAIAWKAQEALWAEALINYYTKAKAFCENKTEYTLAEKLELLQKEFLSKCEECLRESGCQLSCSCAFTNLVSLAKFNAMQHWTKFLRSAIKSLTKATQCTSPAEAKMRASDVFVW